VIVSGLVLNFIPDPGAALTAMRERVRRAGVVAAYVWDYAVGIEFLRHFWQAAVSARPSARAARTSLNRFGVWQLPHVTSLFEAAGLAEVRGGMLTNQHHLHELRGLLATVLGGLRGRHPSYVACLSPSAREALAEQLRARLPTARTVAFG
jgi:hypothetical protein